MNVQISVVMSVYNNVDFLKESIESILTQSFKDFEFVIINDGSTDGSDKIIESYAKKDKRIKYISRENKGLIASLNEGIINSKGKYIARMDGDDIAHPDRFKIQYNFLEQNNDIDICGTWLERFTTDPKKSTNWKFPLNDKDLKTLLIFSTPFAHPTIMMRKSIFQPYDENFKNVEDYELWFRLSDNNKYANIPKYLLKYRYHQESVSRIANKKYELRKSLFSNIYKNLFNKLKLPYNEYTLDQHFIVSSNERMKEYEVDLSFLKKHIRQIIKKNIEINLFDNKALLKFLSSKYFIATIYQLKKGNYLEFKNIFSTYFFCGLFINIKKKLYQY
ncbi:glycosyltransferase [Halobacteriovorax sp. DA5]|uniref:glycosyltransferase n=1 Tax=Halobacteriovorax sp. DA5 TaxID=2067553 RepID=UPI000CD10965|nr:glycosyltransferase [Halobacteriovorax sp. DA5]POB13205.1 hypothetical protein C0Z22_11875 [Halobacteriovorax sp. DA5]